jgi:hypothetical protein
VRGLVATVAVALVLGAPVFAIVLVLPMVVALAVGIVRTEHDQRRIKRYREALQRRYGLK